MRHLGEELGLLGSSLYSHVESKEQLLVEVIESGAELFQALADRVAAGSAPPDQKLAELLRGHVGIITEHQDQSATFLNEARFLPSDSRAAIVAMRDRYEAAFREIIADGMKTGVFREQDPVLASILVLSVLNALTRWYRPGGSLSGAEIADSIVEFAMEGLQ